MENDLEDGVTPFYWINTLPGAEYGQERVVSTISERDNCILENRNEPRDLKQKGETEIRKRNNPGDEQKEADSPPLGAGRTGKRTLDGELLSDQGERDKGQAAETQGTQ